MGGGRQEAHGNSTGRNWASWGVDYLKYDFCGLEKVPPKQKVPKDCTQSCATR